MSQLIFEESQNAELIQQYFKLRATIFSNEYGINSYNNGKDKYDDTSIFILAHDGSKVWGGRRIILPAEENNNELPFSEKVSVEHGGKEYPATMDKLCDHINKLCKKHSYAEFGAMCLDNKIRGGGLGAPNAAHLYKSTMEAAKNNGLDILISCSILQNSLRMEKFFQREEREGRPVNYTIRSDIEVPYKNINEPIIFTIISPISKDKMNLLPQGLSNDDLKELTKEKAKKARTDSLLVRNRSYQNNVDSNIR